MEPCSYDRETILANLAPYPYGEHNPCPYECFDTEEDGKRRLDSIVFLVTTTPSMGLQDHLAFDFFKKFYVSSMIGHETVRGFAEDMVQSQYWKLYEKRGIEPDLSGDIVPLLVSIGIRKQAAERFAPSITDRSDGLMGIARQVIRNEWQNWAKDYYQNKCSE
ncbi:hypothetical protein [Medusavirus stheno T3]|uniref:Uncharacterized protein n=1 Tax=Medusavirus stheno T3 TaxID=3069717 RepID=A0A7S7YEP4_9VIRU|nr:hypothetical protein QKU73_gp344 [Acanthamoeba castellanii medusavirus]QPB44431.1 hypothetical protein [Medusavirus stheno T3]